MEWAIQMRLMLTLTIRMITVFWNLSSNIAVALYFFNFYKGCVYVCVCVFVWCYHIYYIRNFFNRLSGHPMGQTSMTLWKGVMSMWAQGHVASPGTQRGPYLSIQHPQQRWNILQALCYIVLLSGKGNA